jgi:hypothetical protein
MEGMEAEHCRRANADTQFTTTNYKVTTTPREEWEFVVSPVAGKEYPHTPKDKAKWPAGCGWQGEAGREAEPLETFMKMEEVKRAGLKKEEVVGLRLYTGPTFILYNARLRGFPGWVVALLHGNDYETTIFIIASGITKLAKITPLPSNRLVYRGCGGMILPRNFWEDFEECQATLAISAASPESADAAVRCLKEHCTAAAPAAVTDGSSKAAGTEEGAQASAFDLGSTHLRLNLEGEAAKTLLAGRPGVRVVKAPSGGPGAMQLKLALPLSGFDLADGIKEELEAAVVASCGGKVVVKVEEIANKPKEFKGGGDPAPPLHLQPKIVPNTKVPAFPLSSSLQRFFLTASPASAC